MPTNPVAIMRAWLKDDETTHPVLWMDDSEWDFARLTRENIPADARAADHEGEWTYVLQRVQKNDIVTYEPYNIKLPTRKDDVPPGDLNDATSWRDYTDFLKADPPEMEKLAKAIVIAFIVSAFSFGFILILVLLGGE